MAFYDDTRIVTEYDKFTTTTYVPLCLFATKYKSVGKSQVKKIIETIAGSDRLNSRRKPRALALGIAA